MLGAEIAKYRNKVATGEAQPPTLPPPSLEGLHIGAPRTGMVSQSLPSGRDFGFLDKAPPKPRVRPQQSPSSLNEMPIMELPEPSPQGNSLLEGAFGPLGESPLDSLPEEGDDDIGGMCASPHPDPRARGPSGRRGRTHGGGGARMCAQSVCARRGI